MDLGKSIQEISLGDKASFSKTITDNDIWAFSGISGDFNPVHVNDTYANNSRFKGRIAHGPVATALICPIIGMMLPGLGTVLLELNAKYVAPVYPLDTITVSIEVTELNIEKNICTFLCTWTNQDEKVVIEGLCRVKPPVKKTN